MEYARVERNAYCRACDEVLVAKQDMAIKMYSIRNRGQNILLCGECVHKMEEMVNDYVKALDEMAKIVV